MCDSQPNDGPIRRRFLKDLADGKAVLPGGEKTGSLIIQLKSRNFYPNPSEVLFRYIIFTYMARLVTLSEQGMVPPKQAADLEKAISRLKQVGLRDESLHKKDLFSAVHEQFVALGAPETEHFQHGTGRQYLQTTVFRMAVRDELFDMLEWVHLMQVSLAALLEKGSMPILYACSEQLHRAYANIQEAFRIANTGAVGLEAPNSAVRHMFCSLVAFDGLLDNEWDSLSSSDYLTFPAGVISAAAIELRRFLKSFSVSIDPYGQEILSLAGENLGSVNSDCAKVFSLVESTDLFPGSSPQENPQVHLWAACRRFASCLRLTACYLPPSMPAGLQSPDSNEHVLNMANTNLAWWETKKNGLLAKRDVLLDKFTRLHFLD